MNQLDHLVRATLADRADEAPSAGPVVSRAVGDHRSRPWRPRVPLVAASVAACVAASITVGAVLQDDTPSPEPDAAAPGAAAAQRETSPLLEQCVEVGGKALDPDVFGAGTTVLTSASAGKRAAAILVSDDRTQWADCMVWDTTAGTGAVYVYPWAPPSDRTGSAYEATGGRGSFGMTERYPANVAEVRITFASGYEHTAPAVDGFVAVQLEGDRLGDGMVEALRQYDASGRLVGGPELVPGDGTLPPEQTSLVPEEFLAAHEVAPANQ